jgi:hypothetical protein
LSGRSTTGSTCSRGSIACTRSSTVSFADEEIRQAARMLPVDLIPLTRAAMLLPSTDPAAATIKDAHEPGITRREAARKLITAELEEAIERTLAEGPSIRSGFGPRNVQGPEPLTCRNSGPLACARGDLNPHPLYED